MDTTLYLAFAAFAFTASITPGPNNFMLMSSGALFGFRRTLPHIFGVFIGFNILMLAAIFGLAAVITQLPWLLIVVKIAGATWLAWLGLKFFIAAFVRETTGTSSENHNRSRPFHFYEAALFQWANPKALIMAVAAAGAYVGLSDSITVRALLICSTFMVAGVLSATTWTIAGSTLNRLMSSGRSARILNIIMGILLIGTALMIAAARTHS